MLKSLTAVSKTQKRLFFNEGLNSVLGKLSQNSKDSSFSGVLNFWKDRLVEEYKIVNDKYENDAQILSHANYKKRMEEVAATEEFKTLSLSDSPILLDSHSVKEETPKIELISVTPTPHTLDVSPPLSLLSEKNSFLPLTHPLLGDVVHDFGYKVLYQTSVQSLASTPVWKRQRILRPERVFHIAESKILLGMSSKLSGVITLYYNKKTYEMGIIDGQHRAGALLVLSEKGYWQEKEKNIMVEVFPVESEEDIINLFLEINSSEPVKLIDLYALQQSVGFVNPDERDVEEKEEKEKNEPKELEKENNEWKEEVQEEVVEEKKEEKKVEFKKKEPKKKVSKIVEEVEEVKEDKKVEEKKKKKLVNKAKKEEVYYNEDGIPYLLSNDQVIDIINATTDELILKYPNYFKTYSSCKPPYIYIDTFRNKLFTTKFLQKNHIISKDALMNKLMEANESIKASIESGTKKYDSISESKLKSINFYLGLEKYWFHS